MDWMSPTSALKYLGLQSIEELEDTVVDLEIPVLLDDQGELYQVGTDRMQDALIERHVRRVGFRPDDERWAAQAKRELKRQEDRESKVRGEHGKRLAAKVKTRKAKEASRGRAELGTPSA
jgi:hypothetical protein